MLTALIVIAALVAGLLAIAASRPTRFRYERSIVVAAPPERVAPLVADFHRWKEWSPWEHLDPTLKRSYGGAPSGQGATYAWEGNSKTGTGRMEITEASTATIVIKLDFLKPFEAHNLARFTFVPEGGGTHVSWSMEGPSPFIARLMGIFMNMERMIGRSFEEGLAKLKALAEA